VVAFMLSWRLALAALPLSLMFIIPGVGFGKVLQDLGRKMMDAYGIRMQGSIKHWIDSVLHSRKLWSLA